MMNGHFINELDIRCIPKAITGFRYKLLHNFYYKTNNGTFIAVPIGFKTDFASVPWFFRRIIPATGRYNEATVIHDFLCYAANEAGSKEDRKYADKIFLECMEALGVKKWKRKMMYRGVSLYTFFKR